MTGWPGTSVPGLPPRCRGTPTWWGRIAANDNRWSGPSHSSALPSDALAIIEPVPAAANRAGGTPDGRWRLRFAERWRPRVDPLTGGGDPLAQIDLRFPDLRAAERYCRREGIAFRLRFAAMTEARAPLGFAPRPKNGLEDPADCARSSRQASPAIPPHRAD